MVRVAFQAGVVYPGYVRAVLQPAGHGEGAAAVARHPQVQGLQAQVQVKGVLGALGAAQVPHQMGDGLGDKRGFSKLLGVGEAVVGGIRRGEAGEFVGVLFPGEVAAVHYGSAYAGAVSVNVFGGGMRYNIGPPLERAAQHGRSEGVVNHQRQAVFVRHGGPAGNIQHLYAGVGEGFPEDELGVGADGGLNLAVRGIGLDKANFNAEFCQCNAQQVEGAAVDVVGRDDMVSCAGDVQAGKQVGGLAGGGEDGAHAAFQGAKLRRHGIYRGVLQAGIEVPGLFQVEQAAHLVRCLIFKGRALDNGKLPRLALLGAVAGMYA